MYNADDAIVGAASKSRGGAKPSTPTSIDSDGADSGPGSDGASELTVAARLSRHWKYLRYKIEDWRYGINATEARLSGEAFVLNLYLSERRRMRSRHAQYWSVR